MDKKKQHSYVLSVCTIIEIKDIKGTENVAADHLSRIDNNETSDNSEVDDNFPGETLMEINTSDEPVTAAQAPVVSTAQGVQGKWGNPQYALKDKGVIDSGCSRHMTGNMSYLSNFEELNGGYVAFGGHPITCHVMSILQVVQIVLWYLDSGCSKHMIGDRKWLINFVEKFIGTVRFGNDQVAKIVGFWLTLLPLLGVRQMSPETLKELQE
nr:ribonuclease H-like domain-containing protein [Tanacetum cinerariifolium]